MGFRAFSFTCRVFTGWVFIGCSPHFEHRVFTRVFMGVHRSVGVHLLSISNWKSFLSVFREVFMPLGCSIGNTIVKSLFRFEDDHTKILVIIFYCFYWHHRIIYFLPVNNSLE